MTAGALCTSRARQRQPAAAHDLVELARDRVPDPVAVVVVLAAQVEAQPRLARHDVDRAGERLELADRADDVVLRPADALDGERGLAGAEQRVVAHVVAACRRRAGPRPSICSWNRRALAIDETTRERLAAAVELGALLDVRLEVARPARRARARPRRCGPGRGRTRGTPRAASCRRHLGQVPPRRRSSVPGHRRRAEQRLAEPGALLVRERDDLERERGRRSPSCGARSSRTISSAMSTPTIPSYRPASGTVSRCEPEQQRGRLGVAVPASRADWLPAASCLVSCPTSRIHSAARRFTRACSGER